MLDIHELYIYICTNICTNRIYFQKGGFLHVDADYALTSHSELPSLDIFITTISLITQMEI